MVNVIVLFWFDHLYFEASHGVAAPLFSSSTKTSDSYTGPNDQSMRLALNGLNPHVQVAPCSFEIVTDVPAAALSVAAEVLSPDPLPAVAQTAATAAASSRTRSPLLISYPSLAAERP